VSWRRFFLAALAVFVAQAVLAGVLQLLLESALEQPAFSRAEGDEKLAIYFLSRILFVLVFTYIFVKGYEGRGPIEGLRYGLLVWLLYSIPMTVGFWAFYQMSGALALAWIGIGLVEMLGGGLTAAIVYRPFSVMEAGT
jgi:hypothetical protein